MKKILNYIVGIFTKKSASTAEIITDIDTLKDTLHNKQVGDVVHVDTTDGIKKIEFL